MLSNNELSVLIAQIYECALDKSRWPSVIGEICRRTGGIFGDLSVLNTLSGHYDILALHNWPPDFLQVVQANMHANPFISLGLVMPLAKPFCVSRDYGLEQMRQTPYWHRVIKGHGTGDLIIIPLKRTTANLAFLGITGSEERVMFSDEDIALAGLLAPHVQKSVHIAGLLDHRKLAQDTIMDVLDTLAAAAFIVGEDGSVKFSNQAGKMLADDGRTLREVGRRLASSNRDINSFLSHLTERRGHVPAHVSSIFNINSEPIQITAIHLKQDSGATLLLVRSPEPELRSPLQLAAELYSLTTREVQVVTQLLEGQNLKEIGAFLGLARSTVKMHVDSVFAKTGVSRQSLLIKKVIGLSVSVGRSS